MNCLVVALVLAAYAVAAGSSQRAELPRQFLGNYGPYTERIGEGISPETPSECTIDQAILFGRHGERYPEPHREKAQSKLLARLSASVTNSSGGDLAFLGVWEYFLASQPSLAGQEILRGVHSGLADAVDFGGRFGLKYAHLIDPTTPLPVFAAGMDRIVDTAKAFSIGLLGFNASTNSRLVVVPETDSRGGDSLHVTACPAANTTTSQCSDYNLDTFFELQNAASRINGQYKSVNLTTTDIYTLLEIAAFDIEINGLDSAWTQVFTSNEWLTFNYIQSMWFYCQYGPASNLAVAVGSSLNGAVSKLLTQGPATLPLSLNFVHDVDITRYLAGTGLLYPSKPLSSSAVTFGTGYDITEIAPMGARLVIERLVCGRSSDKYVRVLLNDAVVPVDFDQSGPGFSASLANWTLNADQQLAKSNYSSYCQPNRQNLTSDISFWWIWATPDGVVASNLTATNFTSVPFTTAFESSGTGPSTTLLTSSHPTKSSSTKKKHTRHISTQ